MYSSMKALFFIMLVMHSKWKRSCRGLGSWTEMKSCVHLFHAKYASIGILYLSGIHSVVFVLNYISANLNIGTWKSAKA